MSPMRYSGGLVRVTRVGARLDALGVPVAGDVYAPGAPPVVTWEEDSEGRVDAPE